MDYELSARNTTSSTMQHDPAEEDDDQYDGDDQMGVGGVATNPLQLFRSTQSKPSNSLADNPELQRSNSMTSVESAATFASESFTLREIILSSIKVYYFYCMTGVLYVKSSDNVQSVTKLNLRYRFWYYLLHGALISKLLAIKHI